MGYCDYLYRPDNIIGYSGDLNNNPTVYFVTESRDENGAIKTKQVGDVSQILFLNGHITQAHGQANNIGRELVTESYSYSIMNVDPNMIDGFNPGDIQGKRLQETYHQSEVPQNTPGYYPTPDGFSDFHVSRSVFKSVDMKDYATLMKLANAIAKFPRLKQMYGARDDGYIQRL